MAVEYGHVVSDPAAGRRRRLKTKAKRPVYLDSVHQMQALLDAATELDEDPNWTMRDRRANVAGLLLAGPRAHEQCGVLWRDLDLGNDRMEIGTGAAARSWGVPRVATARMWSADGPVSEW